jgi:hypothetical protein
MTKAKKANPRNKTPRKGTKGPRKESPLEARVRMLELKVTVLEATQSYRRPVPFEVTYYHLPRSMGYADTDEDVMERWNLAHRR